MISVIMSMYNVEKYIERAITSILSQTYTDLELIIVDDCSTDNSLKIAETFIDSRIKIIKHIENKGAGWARHTGISAAKGDDIITIDSDDWIEPQFLNNLILESENSDMTFGGMIFDFEDGRKSEIFCRSHGIYTGRDKFTLMMEKKMLFLNNCLVKRHLYDKVTYNTKRYNEDTPTLAKLLYYANNVNMTAECGYHYTQQQESLCHGTKEFYKHLCLLDTTVELMEFFENKPAEYANLVHLNDLFLHLSYLGDKNLIEEYQSEFNNVIIKVISRIKRI